MSHGACYLVAPLSGTGVRSVADPLIIDPIYLALVALLAFGSSIIGGISGFGAGLIITPVLLPLVGIKGVIPVVGVAMIVGNLARVFVYRTHIDRSVLLRMLIAILPGTVLGVWLYAMLPAQLLAVFIGCVLILSVPARRQLQARQITPSPTGVSIAAFLCGVLAGNAPGGGVIIITLLLGMGLHGPALLGTDAIIGTAISLTNSTLFGTIGLLDWSRFIVGIIVGCAMIPGAFLARALISRMRAETHVLIVEGFVILGGLSFFWAAIMPPQP